MKIKELKTLPNSELQKKLIESREKLRDLRFKIISKQVKNIREFRELKKTIARILTFLSQQAAEPKIKLAHDQQPASKNSQKSGVKRG